MSNQGFFLKLFNFYLSLYINTKISIISTDLTIQLILINSIYNLFLKNNINLILHSLNSFTFLLYI